MSRSFWIGSIAIAMLSAAAARAADAPEDPRLEVGPVEVQRRVFEFAPKPLKLGDYWLGVECYPAGGALRAQLGLPEDQGLVVENVVPDGPAVKAGIARYDVLVKAGEKPLKEVTDLIEVVETAQDKELSLELIRGGKTKTIAATPAKRPEEARPPGGIRVPGNADWERINKWLEEMAPKGSMQFRFFHPPALLPPGAAVHPPLPGDMSVTITKQGDKPAKVVVKRGDETWELTAEDLDKLPEDVRPHVERMLGRVSQAPMDQIRRFDFVPDRMAPGHPQGKIKERLELHSVEPPQGPIEGRMEKRLEEMDRRIEQLRKSIDQLRESRPRLKKQSEKELE